jgi:hypothetical protein
MVGIEDKAKVHFGPWALPQNLVGLFTAEEHKTDLARHSSLQISLYFGEAIGGILRLLQRNSRILHKLNGCCCKMLGISSSGTQRMQKCGLLWLWDGQIALAMH